MQEGRRRLDIKRFDFFVDLLCKKIDQDSEVFMERVQALINKDKEQVDFIENMKLKPINDQIKYLVAKVSQVLEEAYGTRSDN